MGGQILLSLHEGHLKGYSYVLDNLEEYYPQERVDLRALLVRPAHLAFRPLCKCDRAFQRAGDDQQTGEEEPEVSVLGGERVGAILPVVLGDDLNDGEGERDKGKLEDRSPGALVGGSVSCGH